MRKKGYKGRCEKRVVGKCEGVCRIYDPIQSAYADILQQDDRVVKFQCNVLLEGLAEGEYYRCLRKIAKEYLEYNLGELLRNSR